MSSTTCCASDNPSRQRVGNPSVDRRTDKLDGDGRKRRFNHPYEPYEIQVEFMNQLYECLDQGQIGIFESPTGTGKSLSILCSALAWLRDHKRKQFEAEDDSRSAVDLDEPAWMLEHYSRSKREDALARQQQFERRLAAIREAEAREKRLAADPRKRFKRSNAGPTGSSEQSDSQFELDEYESDQDAKRFTTADNLSTETRALMLKLGLGRSEDANVETESADDTVRIFYCSRTHSQLSQFVHEARKIHLDPVLIPTGKDEDGVLEETLKQLTLGSRKNLCINKSVTKLGNLTAMNERCLELQKSGGSQSQHRCSFLPTRDAVGEDKMATFRHHIFSTIKDIEDLGALGEKMAVCPYYASRSAIKTAELVTLPYPLLLQKTSREALELPLRDAVVVIDEAHNLMDAINSAHSAAVTIVQVERAREQLKMYIRRFGKKLAGKNRVYVTQTIRVLNSIHACLTRVERSVVGGGSRDGVVTATELLAGDGVDQINLFKLSAFLTESKLARKVDGYSVFVSADSNGVATHAAVPRSTPPTLLTIQQFFLTLVNPSDEGRFFFEVVEQDDRPGRPHVRDVAVRYVLLDPIHPFGEIVRMARAVILAGGTMSPMDDYRRFLFPYVSPDRIRMLSCSHVVPPENIAAWAVGLDDGGVDRPAGPTVPFDFTFTNRSSGKLIESLGRTLVSLAGRVPDGMVVFFPSYAYLAECVAFWQRRPTTSGGLSIYDMLERQKPVFCESRVGSPSQQAEAVETDGHKMAGSDGASAVESILSRYSTAVLSPSQGRNGGVMLAVMGGSLSEGINFSDALGRCVVVVGLPFPNSRSAEWKARIEHIQNRTAERVQAEMDGVTTQPTNLSAVALEAGVAAGRDFYENTTIRAVNQAIGRAIRHKADYASIVLLDRRYASERIRVKLPGWIGDRLKYKSSKSTLGVGRAEMEMDVDGFFRSKR